MGSTKEPKKTPRDVALLHGPTADGQGANVIRVRDGEVSVGEVRPIREGADLQGRELVRLRQRDEHPALCDVEVLHDGADRTAGRRTSDAQGPARVSNAAFRKGWGRVFAAKDRPRPADHELN